MTRTTDSVSAAITAVLVLPDRQRTDLESADAAADLAAVVQIDDLARLIETDAAREERPRVLLVGAAERAVVVAGADTAELEDVGFAQEEVALLRERTTRSA